MAFLVARDPQPGPTSLVSLTNLVKRDNGDPEIGGSYGGFVVLVVVLAAVFFFSCIGIFILLRCHEPTPYERQIRHSRSRSRAEFTSEAPIGPPGIRERFARLFDRRNGWIKASGTDGDEWDPSYPSPCPNASEPRERDHLGYPSLVSYPSSVAEDHLQRKVAPSASTGSVEVELRAPSPDTPLSTAFQHDLQPSEDDIQDSSPPTQYAGERPRGEVESDYSPGDDRHFSVQLAPQETGFINVGSMRKFDNGTKFRESI
ncbi:hypothetical protein LXA43DRAFT_418747 [Ganoderma leucocontextum]|nr:hypothetical protein LXA43DRAFT_418747 [Ganoderma leucocontextum]